MYEGLRVMLGFWNELSWIFTPFKQEKKMISGTKLNQLEISNSELKIIFYGFQVITNLYFQRAKLDAHKNYLKPLLW